MFNVETNKYSHETSSAVRVVSRHPNEAEAIEAADRLYATGFQRFVLVVRDGQETYNPATK